MVRISRENRDLVKGLAFISPWILGFALFMCLPIGLSLYYSFCDYTLFKPPVFCGLDNYRELFHDHEFWHTVRNSLYYAVIVLPAGLLVSLALALLLNRKVPGQSIFRTIVFLPSLVPTIASAILWLWLFEPNLGLINVALHGIGIYGPAWLPDAHWVIPALALMSLWSVGNTVVIYLAGLQDVPRELYEAADLDGAGPARKLLHVTLPVLSPVIFFNLIMAIITVLQVFDTPYLMTANGNKDHSAYFITMFLYETGMGNVNMGYASAIAWVQLLFILFVTALAFWSSKYWVHYQGK
jgi:multiple sugar transport system permease protein